MPDDLGVLLEGLDLALDEYDRDEATRTVYELIAQLHRGVTIPPGTAAAILGKLRRKLLFELIEPFAETLRFAGVATARIRRQYAQALIDQGKVEKAIDTLEALAEATRGSDPDEHAEAVGLQGRVYKQLYVNAVNADAASRASPLIQRHLRRAIDAYLSVHDGAPAKWLWHGINAVALLARAAADGVDAGSARDRDAMARAILAEVERRGDAADAWDRATAMEACVALKRNEDALVWLGRYVSTKEADAFELNSTTRQLREVWRLSMGEPPGSTLLPILDAHLMRVQGGSWTTLAAPDAATRLERAASGPAEDAVTLERTLGRDGVVTLEWYGTGLERCLSVGLVRQRMGLPAGTGFLIRGDALDPRLGEELVFLTNAHVVSDDPAVRMAHGALQPDQTVVVYDTWKGLRRDRRLEFSVKRLLWTSPPGSLDATVLRLDPAPTALAPCPIADALPPPRRRVYVIGHPGGGEPCLSLHDNLLLDLNGRLLHYRAPTERGSSGSPVFDDRWSVIGLHHAARSSLKRPNGKPYAANEGILLRAIAAAICAGPALPPRT